MAILEQAQATHSQWPASGGSAQSSRDDGVRATIRRRDHRPVAERRRIPIRC
jgi:hypothetical protein